MYYHLNHYIGCIIQKFDEYPSKCEDLDEQIHLFHAKAELCSGIDAKVIEIHSNGWYLKLPIYVFIHVLTLIHYFLPV